MSEINNCNLSETTGEVVLARKIGGHLYVKAEQYQRQSKRIEELNDLARRSAWLMGVAAKEISRKVEEHNWNSEPWNYEDAETSLELDKLAHEISKALGS